MIVVIITDTQHRAVRKEKGGRQDHPTGCFSPPWRLHNCKSPPFFKGNVVTDCTGMLTPHPGE